MKRDDGFVLLRSLITIAVILLCAVALYGALAVTARQSGHLGSSLAEEWLFRRDMIMERLR